uniref:Predicted protein n=1 Tax=Hordeum vulgare subsp. vulgare TaxID=112509 RepID=F2EH46_HORVV|nr:predicted protein [Hordeum vulgare subsp. vulgare]
MRRGSVEIRRIANNVSRRATFGKRCAGLLKKAHELAVLCDADLGVLVFDAAGRQFHYCSPNARSVRPLLAPIFLAQESHGPCVVSIQYGCKLILDALSVTPGTLFGLCDALSS